MTALLLAGLAVFTVAGILDLLPVVLRRAPWLAFAGAAAGSACLSVVGAAAVAGHELRLGFDGVAIFGATSLATDRLSGLFLLLMFAVATPVCLVLASWARLPGRLTHRALGTATALALGSCAVIVTADNSFVFLFAWETLTFAFFLMSGYHRGRRGTVTDSLFTLVFGKGGGQLVLLGFLTLYATTGTFALTGAPAGIGRSAAYVLLVAGFAVKVGLVPGHVWMPPGYSAAPGPVRALMSGVAVNVGFYGLWRTLGLLGAPPAWLPVVLLLLGGFTAILGIAHAAVQTRLSRVIAYSSVENAGLIVVGYSVALIGADRHDPRMVAIGLLAASLQMVAHAVAKSLLFTAAGSIETACGSDELEDLRGVVRRLPFSGGGLAVGAFTLAGLPPSIGFVSEWFLLEATMQQFRVEGLGFRLALAAAGALIALTAGFASVAFVRILGLTVFGPRRPTPVAEPTELRWTGRVGLAVLALGCLGLAAVSPLGVRVLSRGLSPLVPAVLTGDALKSPWVLQPVYADFSILSPSWLWIVLPAMAGAVAVAAIAVSRGSLLRVRTVPAWRSATEGVEGEDQYTPFGYAHPTRKVLANLLLTRNSLTTLERATGGRTGDRRRGPAGAHLGYTTDVVEVVERFVYRPLMRPVLALARYGRRLQSGRLDAYLTYMLIALVAVLAVVTAMA
ncbi:proton-conducting transporter transmembrane domain-containing protein [Actinocatenispora comari]|uniref:Hydrogenase 4 subunit B n=1 Tax=Actinocatenispora comari TaxID=2807577 RepID=A0A8J4A6Z5_9ACTN|nr:proton-conducting transporter membrane subunit [Actinocatenispora comari]GIL25438.1 hydrogenase 4 subunit B [Actinocatenispora comari]